MDKLTFGELAIKVLRVTFKPMTVEEIWEYAEELGYDIQVGTKGKTPWQTMRVKIYVDLKDILKHLFSRLTRNKRVSAPV